MDHHQQHDRENEYRRICARQLTWVKYLLAGILALAVFGYAGDWDTNLTIHLATFSFVYTVETLCTWTPKTIGRLASVRRRSKAAAAERERRLQHLWRDLERAEVEAGMKCKKTGL